MIICKDNKILVQKRKGSKLWPGYYALPAGHIDEGENQYDALIREAQEELGIVINLKKKCLNRLPPSIFYETIEKKFRHPWASCFFNIVCLAEKR